MKAKHKNKLPRTWLYMALGVSLSGALVFLVIDGLSKSRMIVEKFSDELWKLPSKIYSDCPLLSEGDKFSVKIYEEYWKGLGYREITALPLQPGTYIKNPSQIAFCSKQDQSLSNVYDQDCYEIDVLGQKIQTIKSILSNGKIQNPKVEVLKLEPMLLGTWSSTELRTLYPLQKFPKALVDGVVAMEDRGFYQHHGVSFRGIARAILNRLKRKSNLQGGSTISQQLVKNFFLSPERTVRRKVRELWITIFVELIYSKEQILEAYLNEIYLGQNGRVSVHGFGEASKFYFAKEVGDLTLGEIATLIGLIPSPGNFSPYLHPKASAQKRTIVLKKMREEKVIDRREESIALKEPIVARGMEAKGTKAPYFVNYVKGALQQAANTRLSESSVIVQSTLQPLVQTMMEHQLSSALKKFGKEKLEMSAVFMDAWTGKVLGLIGGKSYEVSQYDRATQSYRQVGSLMKPFIATYAFSQGMHPLTRLPNTKAEFEFSGTSWEPKNYGDKYSSAETILSSLLHSYNIPFVNLAADLGFPKVLTFLKSLGFSQITAYPSALLGGFGSNTLEMARAYSIFPNGGFLPSVQWIHAISENAGGDELKVDAPQKVVGKQTVSTTLSILRDVPLVGTAKQLAAYKIENEIGGKTGTTNDGKDVWFAGFNSKYVLVVWAGYDQAQKSHFTGGAVAAQLWGAVMKQFDQLESVPPFEFDESLDTYMSDAHGGCVGPLQWSWKADPHMGSKTCADFD